MDPLKAGLEAIQLKYTDLNIVHSMTRHGVTVKLGERSPAVAQEIVQLCYDLDEQGSLGKRYVAVIEKGSIWHVYDKDSLWNSSVALGEKAILMEDFNNKNNWIAVLGSVITLLLMLQLYQTCRWMSDY